MRAYDVYGINNGMEPDDKGPVVRRQTIELDTNGMFVWDSNGGEGSSVFGTKAFQTIFVDNSEGQNALRIKCGGTGMSFKVPRESQGYFPLISLRNDYSFFIEGGMPGQEFDIALFNVMLPTAVWKIEQ